LTTPGEAKESRERLSAPDRPRAGRLTDACPDQSAGRSTYADADRGTAEIAGRDTANYAASHTTDYGAVRDSIISREVPTARQR
jgi:hypothetical protein